jgi:hypothetical protein
VNVQVTGRLPTFTQGCVHRSTNVGLDHQGGFRLTQLRPGVFVWTTPTGRSFTTDTTHNDEDQ